MRMNMKSVVKGLQKISGHTHPLRGAKITTNSLDPEFLTHLGARNPPIFLNSRVVIGSRVMTYEDYWIGELDNHQRYWERINRGLDWGFGDVPDMIADDGGDIVLLIREGIQAEKIYEETRELPDPYSSHYDPNLQAMRTVIWDGLKTDPYRYRRIMNNLVGISQITPSTGAVKILKMRPDGTVFEPSNFYDCPTKRKFDNWYGSHLSLPEGLKRVTGGPIANKNIVLCGYGDVGKGCAYALKEAGANVLVIKNNNPYHAVDAIMDGIHVKTLDEIVPVGDIFITTTDTKDIITVDHMKNNAIICSTGQFDNDIDMQGLETYREVRRITVSPHANKWVFPETNNGVIVLAGGRIMNLGCADGNPSFVESSPHIDQVIGLIELWKEKDNVQDLNRELTSESSPSYPDEIDVLSTAPPSLRPLRELYGCTRPLWGANITLSPTTMTMTTKTLTALGAEIRSCTPNFFSPLNPAGEALAALKKKNFHVYWEYLKGTLDYGFGDGPDLIADDKGDLTLFIREGIKAEIMYEETGGQLPDSYFLCDDANLQALRTIIRDGLESDPNKYRRMVKNLVGISQITPTGAVRILKIRADGTTFEPINLYDSVTKTKLDNRYGSHLSLPEGLKRAIGCPIAGKDVVLCGYGGFGKHCADALDEAGANVFVIKNDPDHAFDALIMEGNDRVKTLDEIVSVGDIFITTTDNKDIITVDHMKKMKNDAIILSIGQFDNEIDMQGLETHQCMSSVTVSPLANKWVFPETNNGVIVLADGRMMNLGCATGNPGFVEHCPNTDQVIGLIELWKQKGAVRDA